MANSTQTYGGPKGKTPNRDTPGRRQEKRQVSLGWWWLCGYGTKATLGDDITGRLGLTKTLTTLLCETAS